MQTLKQLKPIFKTIVKGQIGVIFKNVLIDEKGLQVSNYDTSLLIKDNFKLDDGLHYVDTIELGLLSNKIDANEYPLINFELDAIDTLSIDCETINKFIPFVSKDETRLMLNGLAINNNSLVATDGFCLKYQKLNNDINNNYIIPVASLKILSRLLKKYKIKDNIIIKLNEEYAIVDNQFFTLKMNLIQREYPKWSNLIPTKYKKEFTIDKWIDFKSVKVLFNERYAGKVVIDNGLVVLETVNAEYKRSFIIGTCDDKKIVFEFGVNLQYLDKVMKNANSNVVKYRSEIAPFLIGDSVLMPLKLN